MAHEPSITFFGAARNVTGSRTLLHVDTTKVLVDCGLYQERGLAVRNWDRFPVNPSEIDSVVLTHAHLDHSGYLPRLVADGFRGPIYCTGATAEVTQIILEDSARIQEEDAAYKRRRHQREHRAGPYPEVPLYNVDDARAAIDQLTPLEYGHVAKLGRQLTASLHDAGHILGSSTARFELGRGEDRRTVVFSGDLGRRDGLLLHDPEAHDQADYVVIESTYGDRTHPPRVDAAPQIARIINETVERGGNVLIPSFAVERAQDLLFMLKTLIAERKIPNLLCFVDSPMATDVTRVFEHWPELLDPELHHMLEEGDSPFRFPGLTFVRGADESKAINRIHGSVLIIAGAGMCNGGRIKHHLFNRISDPNSSVVFVGYQAHGTLGRTIVDGENPVRILGQQHEVNARIEIVEAMSSHADRNGLTRWLDELDTPPRKVFVIHGEEEAAVAFTEHLSTERGLDAAAPEFGDHFTFD